MEPSVRSLPITIIDFLAVFLPGFVWLMLLVATFKLVRSGDLTLNSLRGSVAMYIDDLSIWGVALIALICSLVIGNLLKPVTMEVAERILCIFGFEPILRFLLSSYLDISALDQINYRIRRRKKKLKIGHLRFPFDQLHKKKAYYKKVRVHLRDSIVHCPPNQLPGHRLFSAAKRYIRSVSPTLWEESERMEAEVRMSGALFLASIYSSVLVVAALVFHWTHVINLSDITGILFWLGCSLLALLTTAVGWTHLRHNEVRYTYINILIAVNSPSATESSPSTGTIPSA